MKSKLIPSIVLAIICIVVTGLLATVNLFTADIIEDNNYKKEQKAIAAVYRADGAVFEAVDIDLVDGLPSSITAVYTTGDGGYVMKASVKGYKSGLVIMIGIDANGLITGVKHIASQETNGVEVDLNKAYVGKNSGSSVDAIAGSTKTSEGYRKAVTDAYTARTAVTEYLATINNEGGENNG